MSEPTRVVIGTELDQYLCQRVLEYSIRLHAKHPIEIQAVHQKEERVGGTNFGYVRFYLPKMFGYKGKAIYQDADQLVFTDLKNLVDALDEDHKIALVNHPEGTFNNKPVPQHNQTSVCVLNCEKLKDWNPETMFNHIVPNRAEKKEGQIHYRDFIMLSWMNPDDIQSLDPGWNHFNIKNENTKIVHFSHVRSQPWKNETHPLLEFWGSWLRRSIEDGFVSRREVLREIYAGRVAKHVLRYVPFNFLKSWKNRMTGDFAAAQ